MNNIIIPEHNLNIKILDASEIKNFFDTDDVDDKINENLFEINIHSE